MCHNLNKQNYVPGVNPKTLSGRLLPTDLFIYFYEGYLPKSNCTFRVQQRNVRIGNKNIRKKKKIMIIIIGSTV